jgi:hypothetical protein
MYLSLFYIQAAWAAFTGVLSSLLATIRPEDRSGPSQAVACSLRKGHESVGLALVSSGSVVKDELQYKQRISTQMYVLHVTRLEDVYLAF